MGEKRLRILVVQDKLGITDGYKAQWNLMLLAAGLVQPWIKMTLVSPWRDFRQDQLLSFKKNRKTPGFNLEPGNQIRTLNWLKDKIELHGSHMVVFMCPSMLFIVNGEWSQATTDTLRGGVYSIKDSQRRDVKVLVTNPIHSINTQMKAKDIAALNNGISEKDEFEEIYNGDDSVLDNDDDGDDESRTMEWYNPVIVPYGRFCFQADLYKLGRLARVWQGEVNGLIESGLPAR